MSATPPPQPPVRQGRGPAWLSRSLVVSAALWLVLLGASLGATFDLARAWVRIRTQGFEALGFTRSSFLFLERAADHGTLRGAMTALWFLILALLASAYAPVRALFDPRELSDLLVTRERLFRAQVATGVAFLIAALVLANTGPGISSAQLYLLGAFAVLGVLALAAIGRLHRRGLRANDPGAEATAFGACAAAGIVVVLGYAALGERLDSLGGPEALAALVLLALGAVSAFALTRRAILASGRARAPADRAALGGRAVRAALVLALLPALAPLGVRAAAAVFGQPGVRASQSLNVVVIAIDALRADSVDWTKPAEGVRDRTPRLRELAAHGVRFDAAITQAPRPAAAYASMLTGKYPLEHGAVRLESRLAFSEVTLAEILREAGYATGAFVSNGAVDLAHGFAQGYDQFGQQWIVPAGESSSAGLTDQALEFVQAHSDEPFHLLVQHSDPGDSYLDHPEWSWADGYDGWWRGQHDLENLVRNRNLVGPADLAWLRDLHDEEVAATDAALGRLIDGIRRAGVAERTLFVVVGGHGEEFLDHGNFGHGTSLYEEVVRVPLLVALHDPALAGTTRADVVETRAVFGTVLDRLGIDFAIRSRPPSLLAPPADPERSAAFSTVWLSDAAPESGRRFEIVSMRTSRFKLIHDLTREAYSLYDVAADPRETADLAPSAPSELAPLRALLDDWLEGQRVHARASPDAATLAAPERSPPQDARQ